jgi:hypothetical protein
MGRQRECQKPGKYPDHDGIRWWCGLHNPDRQLKVKPAPQADGVKEPAVNRDILVGMRSDHDNEEIITALEEARLALVAISNTSVSGWAPNTPAEKYQVIIAHMADIASRASGVLTTKISRFKS